MKGYLASMLAALLLAMIAPSAVATRVIFDPPGPSGIPPPVGTDCTLGGDSVNDYTPCNISKRDTPYAVAFVDCSTLTGLSAQGWCLFMTNVTGGSLNTFRFQFTVPAGGSMDGNNLLHCGSVPRDFASDNCQDDAIVTAGELLDVSFFATLPNNTNFYLITDFNNQPDPATVTVSAPEPGELGLFGLGLLVLGIGYGWQRRYLTPRDR